MHRKLSFDKWQSYAPCGKQAALHLLAFYSSLSAHFQRFYQNMKLSFDKIQGDHVIKATFEQVISAVRLPISLGIGPVSWLEDK